MTTEANPRSSTQPDNVAGRSATFCCAAHRPRLVDLFCGAGGAGMGYHLAGFEVIGVDIDPQPNYPFEFIQADAMTYPLEGFAAAHASPPCQRYSIANNIHGRDDHPDLLPAIRERLEASGLPYVIENVPGAPMHMGHYPLLSPHSGVLVCGLALGLNVKRHRLFESNLTLKGTTCPKGHPGDWLLVFGHTVLERGRTIGKTAKGGSRIRRKHVGTDRGREAMGIPWMTRDELSQAIPPAYTHFIGQQLIDAV